MTNILLVEDDEFLAQLYASQLAADGLHPHRVASAQAALDWLDEHAADAVLLDIALPEHNGIEVLNELQSHSDWAGVPVIVLSSQPKSSFGAVDWRSLGVRRYLYKPELDLADLPSQVKAVLV